MAAPIDLSEIEALAEFREPLEITAVRLACTRAAEPDLDDRRGLRARGFAIIGAR